MDIGKARQLQVGQLVHYPEDRGRPGGVARVVDVSEGSAVNIYGKHYLWVSLRDSTGKSAGVWPSNRLEV